METTRDIAHRVVNRLLGEETTPPAPKPEETEEQPRFESRRASFRGPVLEKGMAVKKAWKQGKKQSGQSVAGKPGKVSYRESLVRTALNNIATRRSAAVQEKMGTGSGMKGVKGGKKNAGTVAKKPGSVGYGKR